jgi:tRNA 2-thiouridine synthesizing protein A
LTSEIYDLRGLNCPLPVLRTRKRLAGLASGAVLVVETTDPLASLDMPAFCSQDGHQLVSTETTENGHRFTIVKG